MFTGIIESTGKVESLERLDEDSRLVIHAGEMDTAGMKQGDSIAINGVCLTVTGINESLLLLDVSAETLKVTGLGYLQAGSRVNLERSLQLSDRLHGHIVSGHVDCTGIVKHIGEEGRSLHISIEIPASLQRYLSKKGSVCVDGVSLTINEKDNNVFTVNIIPHTLDHTIIKDYREGTVVNIEVDIIARYLESLNCPD